MIYLGKLKLDYRPSVGFVDVLSRFDGVNNRPNQELITQTSSDFAIKIWRLLRLL